MDEHAVVDLDDRVLLQQPAAVVAHEVQVIQTARLGIALKVVPEFLDYIIVGPSVSPALSRSNFFLELPFFGFSERIGEKFSELLGGEIIRKAEDPAGDVDFFMVSEQHVDHAPGCFSLFLEAHQEVENLLGRVSPVQDIPHLDQMGFPGRPVKGVVNDPRSLQDFDEILIVAVQVADRDDFPNARPFAGNIGRAGEPDDGRDKENEIEKDPFSSVPDSD